MKKGGIFKKSAFSLVKSAAAASFFTVAASAMMLYGLKQAESSSVAEGRRILEDGVRRAVVTCYAIEGRYPEDLSYIEEHYGVSIDGEKYTVFYEIEASNVFPKITVVESGEGI